MKYCPGYLRILLITGFVFAAISSAIAQQYYRVTVDGLNIRSGPGKNYNTTSVALKGDTLKEIHDLKGWMEIVAIKNNAHGFVATQMIEKIDVKNRPSGGGFWSFIGKLLKCVFIIAVLYFAYKWIRAKLHKSPPLVKESAKPVVKQEDSVHAEAAINISEQETTPIETAESNKSGYVPLSENEDKGDGFEQFIIKKIGKTPSFSIKRWRSDKFVGGIFAQSNKHPDFEIVFSAFNDGQKTNHAFGLETKWRHYFFNDRIELDISQLNHYRQYAKEENKPVYLIIGVGGKSSDPEMLFLVPLNDIENSNLDSEFLLPYNCGVDDTFYFDPGKGTLELR